MHHMEWCLKADVKSNTNLQNSIKKKGKDLQRFK